MSAWSRAARMRGERMAFVPTMGALHEGHVALLREGRRRGDKLVLSIFVNPTQFGPNEDLARYPRDLPGDLAKAAGAGTDVAFVPEAADMYPPGHQTVVEVRELARGLDGAFRPGHFAGVATVVAKLFNIVPPDLAIFGEKDFQQLAIVRRMVADLAMPIEIVGIPTVREPDGLAMSSRNAYLSPAERARALSLSRALFAARDRAAAGERDAARAGRRRARRAGRRSPRLPRALRRGHAGARRAGSIARRCCWSPPSSAARGSSTTSRSPDWTPPQRARYALPAWG